MRHIHKGIQHTPVLSPVQIGIRAGEPLKMLLEVFIMPVNLPGVLVAFPDPERLHGGNDNAGCPENIGRPDVVDILNVENRHPLHPERRAQRFPAGMGRIPQRLYRLPAYGVGRNQPQHERIFPVQTGIGGHAHTVGGKQRLSPARGEAQTDIRHIVHVPARMVDGRTHIGRMLCRHFSERRFRPPQGRLFQVFPEHAQRFFLVFLQLKHGSAPGAFCY